MKSSAKRTPSAWAIAAREDFRKAFGAQVPDTLENAELRMALAIDDRFCRVVDFMEELAGGDCENATAQSMSLVAGDANPCGHCLSCRARAAMGAFYFTAADSPQAEVTQ